MLEAYHVIKALKDVEELENARKRHDLVQDIVIVVLALIIMAALFLIGGGYV